MAAIATGGSILDINSIVDQLMSLERRPLGQLAAKEASQTAKLTAFGQIKGALSSLQTATDALGKLDIFSSTRASVSGEQAGFTVSSSAGAASGNHSLEVLALAREQRLATAADGSFAPGAGKLTVEFGSVGDDGFTLDSPPRSASLEFEGDTLEALRDAINDDASLGIKASIINNGEHDQLVLTGTATGRNMAFRLSGEDGLAGLSYDPVSPPAGGAAVYSVQTAESAHLKVDGIEVFRNKNVIDDVISGLTINLTKDPLDAGPVKGNISIREDSSGAKEAIEAFVKAYNETHSTLRSLSSYDVEAQQASTLTGDSTVRSIQNQLRDSVAGGLAGLGGASSLAQIGISFDRSGILTIDHGKLDAALADEELDVGALFAGKEGVKGFAETVSARLDLMLDSRDGLIASRTQNLNDTIKSLTDQYERLETRLVTVEERYRLQYSKLDSMLAGMSQTSTYLAQQLATLPQIGG